jgi:hypothetical protein
MKKRLSVKNPPEWLKGYPENIVQMGLGIYNSMLPESGEEKAREAALSVVSRMGSFDTGGAWTDGAPAATEKQSNLRFQAAQAVDASGLVWEAIIIVPGFSLGYPRFYWSEEVLEAHTALFQGVDINAYEQTADHYSHLKVPNDAMLENVKRYLVEKKVGWIEKTWWTPEGIRAEIHFLKEHAWVPKTLQDGIDQGNSDVLGLSIDARAKGIEILVEDMTVILVTEIASCSSVDVVTRPAAGGKFLRAIAGLDKPTNKEEDGMDREKLLKLIQQARPDLLEGKDRAALSDDDVMELARMAMEKPAGGDGKTQRAAQAVTGVTIEEVQKKIKEAVDAEKTFMETRAACARSLDSELAGSDLPVLAVTRIRRRFEGSLFKIEDLAEAVKEEKEYLAAMAGPSFAGVGDQGRQSVVAMGIGTIERAQMAVDRMFGMTAEEMTTFAKMERLDHRPFFADMRAAQDYTDFDKVPSFSGIREMYEFFSGDTEVSGVFNRKNLPADLRASMDITSATFSYLLGNTLGRRMVRDYREMNYQEDLLISLRKPVKDFRQQEAVKVGYFPDLDAVDPQTGDYQEISGVTDEESTYSVGQLGNLLTVTRTTIINDDLSVVQRIWNRIARAARRTHAKYVWDFFIDNGTCSDGTAWFTSGHGNLGATAMGFATVLIAYKALAAMTEKDSGEIIGLLDNPSVKPVLVYPTALMETGEMIVNDDHYYATNDLTDKTRNPLKGKITGARVSLLGDDANDWGLLMPPAEVDMVEMGYLNGRQEPETFVADTPQSEQMFVADKVRYKIRHEYGGAVVDCVSGYKAVVA